MRNRKRPDPVEVHPRDRQILCRPEQTEATWKSLVESEWGKINIPYKQKQHIPGCKDFAHHVWEWAAIRAREPGGFFWTNTEILGFWRLYPPIHDAWFGRLLEQIPGTDEQIFIETHRGSYKTYSITMGWTVWVLGNWPWEEVMICQATGKKARKTVRGIGDVIYRNRKLLTMWPHMKPATVPGETASGRPKRSFQQWGRDGLLIEGKFLGGGEGFGRDWSVLPMGVEMSIAGEHPTVGILDDIHDEKDVDSPNRIQDVKDFHIEFQNTVLSPDSPELVIGTPVGPDDEYNEIRSGRRGKFRHFFMPVRYRLKKTDPWIYSVPKEKVLAQLPEGYRVGGGNFGWDEYEVEKKKHNMPPYRFMTQYMVTPMAARENRFREQDWIQYEPRGKNAPWQYPPWQGPGISEEEAHAAWIADGTLFAALDAATERGKQNDYTAIPIVLRAHNGLCWLVDLVYDKLLPHQTVEALCQLYRPPFEGEHVWWNRRPTGSLEEEEAATNSTCWRPAGIYSEDYAIEKGIMDAIREQEKRTGVRVWGKIRKLGKSASVGAKPRLILDSLEPMFRHHRWRMPTMLSKYSFEDGHVSDLMDKVYQEYLFFGTSRTVKDDFLDSLRMMRKALREGFQMALREEEERKPWEIPKKRHPLRDVLVPVDRSQIRVSRGQSWEPPALARPAGGKSRGIFPGRGSPGGKRELVRTADGLWRGRRRIVPPSRRGA